MNLSANAELCLIAIRQNPGIHATALKRMIFPAVAEQTGVDITQTVIKTCGRLIRDGLVSSEEVSTADGPPKKMLTITTAGEDRLEKAQEARDLLRSLPFLDPREGRE
jgi:hypothetical protein